MANIYKGTLGLVGNTPLAGTGSNGSGKTGVFKPGWKREGSYCKRHD